MEIIRSLFNFKLDRRVGDRIFRILYWVSVLALTVAAIIMLVESYTEYRDSVTGQPAERLAIARFWATLPAYVVGMLLNRLFFEVCFVLLRILYLTESLRSKEASAAGSSILESSRTEPSNTNTARVA